MTRLTPYRGGALHLVPPASAPVAASSRDVSPEASAGGRDASPLQREHSPEALLLAAAAARMGVLR